MLDFKFNNKQPPKWLVIEEAFVLPSFNVKGKYETHENINGAMYTGYQIENFEFSLPLIIRNSFLNKKSTDEIKEALADFFFVEEEAPLEFSFSNKMLMCTVSGPFELKPTVRGFAVIEVTVQTSMYYYERVGQPNRDDFAAGTLTAYNAGIKTPPTQQFKIKEPTTHMVITNETTQESVEFGAEMLSENERPETDQRLLNAFSTSLINWPNIRAGSNLPVVGTAQGRYMQADEFIFVDTFGDRTGKTDWIGPAKQMQLSRQLSGDWEWETRVITPPPSSSAKGRKQFMLLDELKNPLALIEVRNQSSTNSNITVIMSLYDGLKRTQIMFHTTSQWRQRGLVLKMTKRKDEYTCYVGVDFNPVTRQRFNPHASRVTEKYIDYSKEYNRPAVFAHMQDLRAPNYPEMKFNTSYFKLLKFADNTNRRPYIFVAGDEVMVCHDRNLLTINGEPKFLKTLRSDYFDLQKGENTISVAPWSVIESGHQTFRERYL
ncbi:phage tail domain-containing protein [Salinicoccus sesuvii]|uniref:Phage tail domain-containing protein n=1 Tax=Salinicoccus sesuvii TaxID=868281 RepID=A0ABV7N6Q4_9STAP